jgi:hypothetical protein
MTVSTDAAHTGPGWGWMALRTLWVVPLVIGVPLGPPLAFLALAVLWRRPQPLIAAAVFGALGFVLPALLQPLQPFDRIASVVLFAASFFVAAQFVRPSLLAIWARQQAARPRAQAPSRAAARTRVSPTAPVEADALVRDAARLRSELRPDASRAAARPPGGTVEAEPVDLNAASQRTLRRELGLTVAQAKQIVAERERVGSFRSVEQVAVLLGYKPHELAGLKKRATCSTHGEPPRRFARRVDL